jgi:hypothetical protein
MFTLHPVGSTITHKYFGYCDNIHIFRLKDIVQSFSNLHSTIRKSEYKFLTPDTPLGSTITHRKIIGSSCPNNMQTSK